MSRPRISRSELIVMLLPVAGLCYLALRAGRTQPEPPIPQPFQLRVEKIEWLPLTAQDVARGADTKVYVKVATTGVPPQSDLSAWDW
ncbi:MAG TPA: hypothetical protein VNA16_10730, partial [Abditibacteriaceae bacterium]|nr:hypothetical protein [Abditibacteriaceae bacterium]